jgi:hypothetical protein
VDNPVVDNQWTTHGASALWITCEVPITPPSGEGTTRLRHVPITRSAKDFDFLSQPSCIAGRSRYNAPHEQRLNLQRVVFIRHMEHRTLDPERSATVPNRYSSHLGWEQGSRRSREVSLYVPCG